MSQCRRRCCPAEETFASLSSKRRSLPIRAIAAAEDDDVNDVDLIDPNDPEDQNSDADLDFPQGRLCALLVVLALSLIHI